MATEIERKFLVSGDEWRLGTTGVLYRQGYLSMHMDRTVRVRLEGEKGYLTVKGRSVGAVRAEFEYEIPTDDANAMLNELCEQPLIEKTRHKIIHKELTWEVDEFHGLNLGLILAEVELEDEEQPVDKPEWVGEEVTGDPRYYNSNLVANPHTKWAPRSQL